jgi:hypothetical protein
MLRKLVSTLALGATLVGVVGSQASAQPVGTEVGVTVAVPPVYVAVGSPGPGYVWVPRLHRWCYVGPAYAPAWGPAYWPAPAPYFYGPRVFVRGHWDRGYRFGR